MACRPLLGDPHRQQDARALITVGIVSEMGDALRHEVGPQAGDKLSGLFQYFTVRLPGQCL